MRFSTAVAFAATAAPLAVSAKGSLGYCLGVRQPSNACKTYSDFQLDFKTLLDPKAQPYKATVVRTYAMLDGGANGLPGAKVCNVTEDLLKAAKEAGIQVLLGLWLDGQNAFDNDVTEALRWANTYKDTIYGYTVGSEGLYRDQQKQGTGYSASYLLDRINYFKNTALPSVGVSNQKVGTADSWNKFQDGTANPVIQGGVNLFLVNAFAYWQSSSIDNNNATHTYLDDLFEAYSVIQSKATASDLELWNGETGWPTDGGSDYTDPTVSAGTAVAGTKNAQTFWSEGVCAALDWNINVFYFEAFAEPWKPNSNGLDGQSGDETHWGAFSSDRQPVITDLSCNYKKLSTQ